MDSTKVLRQRMKAVRRPLNGSTVATAVVGIFSRNFFSRVAASSVKAPEYGSTLPYVAWYSLSRSSNSGGKVPQADSVSRTKVFEVAAGSVEDRTGWKSAGEKNPTYAVVLTSGAVIGE